MHHKSQYATSGGKKYWAFQPPVGKQWIHFTTPFPHCPPPVQPLIITSMKSSTCLLDAIPRHPIISPFITKIVNSSLAFPLSFCWSNWPPLPPSSRNLDSILTISITFSPDQTCPSFLKSLNVLLSPKPRPIAPTMPFMNNLIIRLLYSP